MSRCNCCDARLTEYELTLKHAMTSEYMDTCMDCLSEIADYVPLMVKGRRDLLVNVEDHTNSVDNEKELDNDQEV